MVARGRRPVSVLERLECGLRRLLPAGSAGASSRSDQRATPAGPGAMRMGGTGGDRSAALQPVAVLVLDTSSGPGRAAKATSTCSRPASPSHDGDMPNGMWVDVGLQGWFHDFWFTERGALPVQLQRARSACSSSATTTCSSSSTARLMLDLGGVHQRLPGLVSRRRRRVGDNHGGRLGRRRPATNCRHVPGSRRPVHHDRRPTATALRTARNRHLDCATQTGRPGLRWARPTRSPCSTPTATRPSRTTSSR